MFYKRCDCGRKKWGRCNHPWWGKSKRLDPHRQSLGTSNRAAAEVEFARLLVEAADTPRSARDAHALSEYAAADIARAADDGATKAWLATLENSYWAALLKYFGADFDIAKLTTTDLRSYIGKRRESGELGQTIRRHMQCLKRAVDLGQERRWLRHPPCAFPKVRGSPPKESQRGHYIPPEQVHAWFAELDAGARPVIAFAALTGLRAFEIQRVSSAWIEELPEGTFLRVPAASSKNRKERLVPLAPMARKILEVAGSFGSTCHRRTMVAAARRAKLARAPTLRDLRHTFATLADSTDRKATQDALGHSSERMTGRYLHSTMARIAKVGAAVASKLGGHMRGAQQAAETAKNIGGRRGFRTHGIQLVRPVTLATTAESQEIDSTEIEPKPLNRAESGAQ